MNKESNSKLKLVLFSFGFVGVYATLLTAIYYVDWEDIYIFTPRPEPKVAKVKTPEKQSSKQPQKVEATVKKKTDESLRELLKITRLEKKEALELRQKLIDQVNGFDKKNWQLYAPDKFKNCQLYIEKIKTYSASHLRLIRHEMKATLLKNRLDIKTIAKLASSGAPKPIAKKDEKNESKPKYTPQQLELIKKLGSSETIKSIEKKPVGEDPAKFIQATELKFTLLQKIKLYKSDQFANAYARLDKQIQKAATTKLTADQKQKIVQVTEKAEKLKNKATNVAYNLIGLKPVEIPTELPDNLTTEQIASREVQKHAAAQAGYPLEVENVYGMRFRFIPAGTFPMGSANSEKGRSKDEKLHKVTISQPFYMQIREISVNQYRLLQKKEDDTVAASKVSWKDAIDFCKRLNQREKLLTDLYALPSEAMWEYACRAQTTTPTYLENREKIAIFGSSFSGSVQKRATKIPNCWGLFDMFGNVKEICLDRNKKPFFFTKPPITYVDGITDPVGKEGNHCVIRGGGWGSSKSEIRAASRELIHPESREWDVGFRIIRLILDHVSGQ